MKFLNISKKFISVRKYIKPRFNQEYYDNKHIIDKKDKAKFIKKTSTQNIYPIDVKYPDLTIASDFYDNQNTHFLSNLAKWQESIINRNIIHQSFAKKKVNLDKSKKPFLFVNRKKVNIESSNEIRVDTSTNLVYNLGYDDIISEKIRASETLESYSNLNELVLKLGYLDLRDFIAINKYVLHAHNHSEYLNQTKAKILTTAISMMNEIKNTDAINYFKKVDQDNSIDNKDKENIKIEYVFNNFEESKNLFYKYYYELKHFKESEENNVMDEFEKYEKIMSLKEKVKSFSSQNKFNKYMDEIIEEYRKQRTHDIKMDADEIQKKIDESLKSTEKKNHENTLLMVKYFAFFNKFNKIYVPTDMNTEKLIHKYKKEKRMKEFTREKMMEEKDPYFSAEEENINNDPEISDKNKVKKNYFDSKYEYLKKKFEESIDQEIIDDLGIILTEGAFSKKGRVEDYEILKKLKKKILNAESRQEGSMIEIKSLLEEIKNTKDISFIKDIINDYYKSYKLDYMYNYLDFFSNKYKIRRKITEEIKRKVSIKEINSILTKMIGCNTKRNDNKYNVMDIIRKEYDREIPEFVDIIKNNTTPSKVEKEKKNAIISEIEKVEKNPFELSEMDRFEIEVYKGIKNDPLYKHYLHTHLSYFSEKFSDISNTYALYNKGEKARDYIRWEEMKKVNNNSIATKKSIDEQVSNQINSSSLEVANQNTVSKEKPLVYFGMGKRKRAKAFARLKDGSGKITVNGKPVHRYFNHPSLRAKCIFPLSLTDLSSLYDIDIKVFGGGINGQLDAIIPAISKAIITIDDKYRQILAQNLCLVHDPRNVEPKKPGRIKARKGYVYNRR